MAVSATQTSQPAAREKGPLVWLGLDQRELDEAYDQIKYAPNQPQITGRYASNSAALRARIGPPKRFAYGATPIEGLDLYASAWPHAPVHAFIHGGGWRGGEAKNYGFLAELFLAAGAHFAVLDFTNVTETAGDLMPLAEQVRRAVAWVYRHAAGFGGDPDRLYVSGHSSGAHLASVVLTTDWAKAFGLPRDLVKGGLLSCGMYDLAPVRLSARAAYVKFNDAVVAALSAQRHVDALACPLIVAHGTCETPEFQRHARDFAAAIAAAGKPVELLVGEGYNHFEMLETLANPYGLLGRAALRQMQLG
jgi:arylformamidase